MGKFENFDLASMANVTSGSTTLSSEAVNSFLANPNAEIGANTAAAPPLTLGGYAVTAAPAAAVPVAAVPIAAVPVVAIPVVPVPAVPVAAPAAPAPAVAAPMLGSCPVTPAPVAPVPVVSAPVVSATMLGNYPVATAPAVGLGSVGVPAAPIAPVALAPPQQQQQRIPLGELPLFRGPLGPSCVRFVEAARKDANYAPSVFPFCGFAAFASPWNPAVVSHRPHKPGNQAGWFDMLNIMAAPLALYDGTFKMDMVEFLVAKDYITPRQGAFILNGYIDAMEVDGAEYARSG